MKTPRTAFVWLSCFGLFGLELVTHAEPSATTLAATSVTFSNATLQGTVNPNGAVTAAYFEYGLTTNYGNISTATVFPAGNAVSNVPGFVVSSTREAVGPNVSASSAAIANRNAVACSADGMRAMAVIPNGGIQLSVNGGETWTLSSAPNNLWVSIACSADGGRLAAIAYNVGIYISTNSGTTWNQSSAPGAEWISIVSSFDGMQLAAGTINGGIHVSTNGGLTWQVSSAPAATWPAIASSADGRRMAAVANNGGIHTSTNGGLTWTQSSAPSGAWQGIAASADGTRLAAVGDLGMGIQTSTNGGLTWVQSIAPTANWVDIASSADGARLAAVRDPGTLYVSTNGGATWIPGSLSTIWKSVALSADGTRMVAAQRSGGIHFAAGANSNLLPGTAYHYRLVAINGAGVSLGADLAFTTLAPVLRSVTRLGTNLIFNVTNGVPGSGWTLLSATNLSGSAQWRTNHSGTFDGLGSATLTNGMAGESRRFFTIRAP